MKTVETNFIGRIGIKALENEEEAAIKALGCNGFIQYSR